MQEWRRGIYHTESGIEKIIKLCTREWYAVHTDNATEHLAKESIQNLGRFHPLSVFSIPSLSAVHHCQTGIPLRPSGLAYRFLSVAGDPLGTQGPICYLLPQLQVTWELSQPITKQVTHVTYSLLGWDRYCMICDNRGIKRKGILNIRCDHQRLTFCTGFYFRYWFFSIWIPGTKHRLVKTWHYKSMAECKKRRNSSALAMELRLFCTKPSNWRNQTPQATAKVPFKRTITNMKCIYQSMYVFNWMDDEWGSGHRELLLLQLMACSRWLPSRWSGLEGGRLARSRGWFSADGPCAN